MTELVIVAESILAWSTTGVIFSGRTDSGTPWRIRSSVARDVRIGECYRVDGVESDYRDGRGKTWQQIEAHSVQHERATGALLTPWLESLPCLGPVRARRLLDRFGERLLDVLGDPDSLDSIATAIDPSRPMLGRRIAAAVIQAVSAHDAEQSVLVAEARFLWRLEQLGVTDRRAAKQLWRLLGAVDGEDRLLANPYLAASIMSWKHADHLGVRLLAARPDVLDPASHADRLQGAIDNVWRSVLAAGDTAADLSAVRTQLLRRGVDPDLALRSTGHDGHWTEGDILLRAPGAAWLEDDLSRRLELLAKTTASSGRLSGSELGRLIALAEQRAGFVLTDEQRGVVQRLLRQSLSVLQGGAGVGKTAVTKVICESWEALGGTCVLAALSGKAALQLSRGASTASSRRLAYTAARLLAMLRIRKEAEQEGKGVPEDWPCIDASTLLVVDEASMMDTPTMRQLVEHLVPESRLLCIGDHGQLPSVGIGRVFHDLVEDGRHVATLSRVLRQAEDSPIPHAASSIRQGKVPELGLYKGQDSGIYLLPVQAKERLLHWKLTYEDQCRRNRQSDVMALAALNTSVDWLNREAALTRRSATAQFNLARLGPHATVAVGDPVVCLRNRYGDALFNGMLGVVTEIGASGTVSVHWDGEHESRTITAEAAAEIGLGYAITCHKSQGSSAQVVVVLLERTRLMTREWIYTAVTRARQLVILVGPPETLAETIQRRTIRVTGFRLATVDSP